MSALREKLPLYWEISKPRLTFLALVMTALGYCLGSVNGPGGFASLRFVWTMLGTALIGLAAAALNQYMERHLDATMDRTKNRPLPSGRLQPREALVLGWASALLGILLLLAEVNAVTAVLGAFTLFFYLGVYTPAKRVSSLATLVGAIPGAIPPLMGWTAAHGEISAGGLLLFGLLFLWQVPHFLAIAWLYREDYRRGDFSVLPVEDPPGDSTVRQALLYALALIPVSLLPSVWGMTGGMYFAGALLAGVLMVAAVLAFARTRSDRWARRLFFASIAYLPFVGFLMIWDRIR